MKPIKQKDLVIGRRYWDCDDKKHGTLFELCGINSDVISMTFISGVNPYEEDPDGITRFCNADVFYNCNWYEDAE